MKHKVAVIAGDGIGPEVLAEGVKVLNAVAEKDGGFEFDFTDCRHLYSVFSLI